MRLTSLKAKLYAFSFLDDCMPIYPLYLVMFTDTGLGAAQVSSLLFAWSLTSFIAEIPSGAIADKYPRKNVLVAGQIIRAIGFAAWFVFPNYWGFLFGFVAWGLKGAFTSGTKQALVYDELKRIGAENSYAKMSGRMSLFDIAGQVVANLVGAALVAAGYGWMLITSVIIGLVSAAILARLPAAAIAENVDEHYLSLLKEGVRTALKNPLLLRIMALTSFVIGFASVDEYYNVFFKELGMGNLAISLWVAVVTAAGAAAGLFAHKLEHNKHFRSNLSIGVMLVAWGAILWLASVSGSVVAPIAITLFAFFFYLVEILTDAWVQHAVTGKARATISSVQGFAAEVGALLAFLVVGTLAEIYNYTFALRVASWIIVVVGILTVLLSGFRKVRARQKAVA